MRVEGLGTLNNVLLWQKEELRRLREKEELHLKLSKKEDVRRKEADEREAGRQLEQRARETQARVSRTALLRCQSLSLLEKEEQRLKERAAEKCSALFSGGGEGGGGGGRGGSSASSVYGKS